MLSKRQKEVLEVITHTIHKKNYIPSLKEIARTVGVSSPATIYEHVQALCDRGYLAKRGQGKGRTLYPTVNIFQASNALSLPLVGIIAAGGPIEALEDRTDTVAVPAHFVVDGANSFVLRVKGDSMIEDGILDGDYVVVERNPSPRNGEVVVALLDNAYATLKRFYREANRIRLQPANARLKPIFVKDPLIQGVVRAVIRHFGAI